MFQVIKTNYSVSLHRLVKDVPQPVCAALQLFILYGCSAEVSFIESSAAISGDRWYLIAKECLACTLLL